VALITEAYSQNIHNCNNFFSTLYRNCWYRENIAELTG